MKYFHAGQRLKEESSIHEQTRKLESDLCLEMFGDSPDTKVLHTRVCKLIAYRESLFKERERLRDLLRWALTYVEADHEERGACRHEAELLELAKEEVKE